MFYDITPIKLCEEADMPEVNNYTGILTSPLLSVTGTVGKGAVLSYNLSLTKPPDYVLELHGQEGSNTFQALSEAYKVTVRQAIDLWDAPSDLIFFEITEGDADMNVFVVDLMTFGPAKGLGVSGLSSFPDNGVRHPSASDVYIDKIWAFPDAPLVPIHEIGHALGLHHPNLGENTIAPALLTPANTIMLSVLSAGNNQLGVFDIQAVQHVYGLPNQGALFTVNGNASGGAGDEHLKGSDGHEHLFGGDGSDTIEGGAGNDHLFGKDLNAGNDGNDTMLGGSGSDYIQGNMGNDLIAAQDGSDRAQGGQGNDTLYGGPGNDSLNGNKGDDKVYGEAGNDALRGGQGSDYLSGGADNDVVNGDLGADTLSGGAGIDTFVFTGLGSALAAPDQVNDFVDGTDRISIGFNPEAVLTGSAQADFQSAQNAAQQLFNGRAGDQEVAALRVGSDTYLFYASNGGGTVDSAVKIVGADPQVFSAFDFT